MNCECVQELLSTYYDRELDRETSAEVQQHLDCCADCAAELNEFKRLSVAVCSASSAAPDAIQWARIADRLEPQPAVPIASAVESGTGLQSVDALTTVTPSIASSSGSDATANRRRFVGWGMAIALAASLLMAVLARWQPGTAPHAEGGAGALVLDYAAVIREQAQQPSLTLDKISQQYSGREVATDQAESSLGYRPAILKALPTETRVVSMRLLTLPNCHCSGGQCQCGPQGCNCAASLCQRKDGSEFLVFEHCSTQDVSFGQLPSRIAAHDAHDVRFIDNGENLAVSWVPGSRRLTAIGLKSEAEADALVSALDKVTMTN